MDQMDWIEKITGVIASLLSAQSSEQPLLASPTSSGHYCVASESSFGSSSDFDPSAVEESSERIFGAGHVERTSRSSQQLKFNAKHEKPIDVLRKVCGNHVCADCGASEPDWASLNLGILVCIECSGVHRNLGVHISKVRSLTLDVRVWEPSVINLFQSLGNTFANSIWEEFLLSASNGNIEDNSSFCILNEKNHISKKKPKHNDPISVKEKFIQAKYAEKVFIHQPIAERSYQLVAQEMWDSVRSNNKKAVYHHIVTSNADVNAVYGQTSSNAILTLAKVMLLQEQPRTLDRLAGNVVNDSQHKVSSMSSCSPVSTTKDTSEMYECHEGWSLLHLACQTADIGMIELLLQYGANINITDLRGMTPLHHCVLKARQAFAKLLLTRGADPHAVDMDGKTPVQYAIESGTIVDEEILVLLEDTNR
ncbi:ADP-ribosylation factor GTPase-activating protein AGD3 [Iris pallida]|uniref:ADP-ribosylation factor GTPase-activating protein AGD3 n=1 Tax=Iris pallida TaxID=29817 RepID=A0AAX6I556_IRIPA|nr:ADP-ribosylation factor GTPase-activating protein AGD3 [Iris pallida]